MRVAELIRVRLACPFYLPSCWYQTTYNQTPSSQNPGCFCPDLIGNSHKAAWEAEHEAWSKRCPVGNPVLDS